MSINAQLALKRRPSGTEFKTGDWVDVRGSNFGPQPNIELFMPMNLSEGQQIKTTSPVVGVLSDISGNAYAVLENGELWLTSRDPTQVASTSANTVTFGFETNPFTQFFFLYRTMAQTGKKFPFASAPGLAPTWSGTIMKPMWFTDKNNTSPADQVIPNFNASGTGMFGNSNTVLKPGGGYVGFPPNSQSLNVNAPTAFAYYQSGDESFPGAMDAQIILDRYDSTGAYRTSFLGDPFAERTVLRFRVPSGYTPTQGEVFQVYFDGELVPNPYVAGSSPTATTIRDGIIASLNANQSFYKAGVFFEDSNYISLIAYDANLPAKVVTVSTNLLIGAGSPIVGPPNYFRLQWMSQTNTPPGGWSNVQMLANWIYLATGANSFAGIFIGDKPTLAACNDPLPFNYDLWTDGRIVFDKLGRKGYVHQRHGDGTVQDNIMGGYIS